MNQLVSQLKSDLSMKGFWIIQLLNVSKILKFIAVSYVKAVCWIGTLSLFLSTVQLSNDIKEEVVQFVFILWICMVFTLFIGFFVTLYGTSELKSRLGGQFLTKWSVLFIYVILGGHRLEIYLGLDLQKLEDLNPFLNNYLPGFVAAFVLSLFVKAIVKFVLEKSVTPIVLEDHSVSWQAAEWLNPFLHPIKTKYEHQFSRFDHIEVELGLRYSFCKFSVGMFAAVPLEEGRYGYCTRK